MLSSKLRHSMNLSLSVLCLDSMHSLQLATLRSAAEVWEFIDAETERRKQQVDSAVTEQKAAKGLPPSQKTWTARPWQSLVCQTLLPQMQQPCCLLQTSCSVYSRPLPTAAQSRACTLSRRILFTPWSLRTAASASRTDLRHLHIMTHQATILPLCTVSCM